MTRFFKGALLALALLLGLGIGGLHPTEALARQSMSFSPSDRSRAHAARRTHHVRTKYRGSRIVRHGRIRPHGSAAVVQRPVGGDDDGAAAKAVPGKGFTMDNGVLTYPAPARFQPQNLRHR